MPVQSTGRTSAFLSTRIRVSPESYRGAGASSLLAFPLKALRVAYLPVFAKDLSGPNPKEFIKMDYDQIPRSALIRLLQEHDAALLDAGKDGIVMSYTGRTAP